MAAKDAYVALTATAWTKISDGNIATALIAQNKSEAPCLIAFLDTAATPDANTPGIEWPGGAVELNLSVPGGLSVWGRALGAAVSFYIKHA